MKKICRYSALTLVVVFYNNPVFSADSKRENHYSRMSPFLTGITSPASTLDRDSLYNPVASVTLKLKSKVPPEAIQEILGLIVDEWKQSKIRPDTFFFKTDRPQETLITLSHHPMVESAYVDRLVEIERSFRYDYYDGHGGKTLRASGTKVVRDEDLREELRQIRSEDLSEIRAVNLIDQGHITDISLQLLAQKLPNLSFLNVENTSVTRSGILAFVQAKPRTKLYYSGGNYTP